MQVPALIAIGHNEKGCELRFEGRKFLVRFEVRLRLSVRHWKVLGPLRQLN